MRLKLLLIILLGIPHLAAAQDKNAMNFSIQQCAANAESADEMVACVGLAATICNETIEDKDQGYIRERCGYEEFEIWMLMVNEEAERVYTMATAFEDHLYVRDSVLKADFYRLGNNHQFRENAVIEQNSWLRYIEFQCHFAPLADFLQNIEAEDPVFCMSPRVAQRLFELRERETHLIWREE